MKKILIFVLLFVFLISCGGKDFTFALEEIKEMTVGEEKEIKINSEQEYDLQDFTVKSSSEDIVKVDSFKLIALKAGVCEITVSYKNELERKLNITVKENIILLEDFNFGYTTEMVPGDKQTLEFTFIPEEASNKSLKITSSDESVVKVNGTTLEAIKDGKTLITISSQDGSNITKDFEINVVLVETIKVSIDKTLLSIGDEANLTIELSDNMTMDNVEIITSQNDIIEVKGTLVKALKAGDCDIIIKSKRTNVQYTVKVKVVDYEITEDAINDYLIDLYDNKEFSSDIDFVKKYYDTDIEFDYSINDKRYIKPTGEFTQPIVDTRVYIMVCYVLDGEDYFVDIYIICKGWGDQYDVAEDYLSDKVPEETKRTLNLPTQCSINGATYKWYLDGVELNDGEFAFERTDEPDYYVTLVCEIIIDGVAKEYTYKVKCIMKESMVKVDRLFNELKEILTQGPINSSVTLPTSDDRYQADISWRSYNPYVLDDSGHYNKPFTDIKVEFMLNIEMGEFEKHEIVTCLVLGENKENMWDKIDLFLNRIHKEEIKTQRFYLYGWEPGYTQVPTENIGYLPFYTSTPTKVTVDILPDGSSLKPSRNRTSTNYITLHNTGMAHPTATAVGLNDYIHTTDRVASWHYSIDDKEAYQELDLDEVGWHAGDGSTVYGDIYYNDTYKRWCIGGGNNNSVGIEMCVYSGVDFNMVMRNTAKVVGQLLLKYNLTPSDIRQHYDFSGKDCPQVIRTSGRWAEMIELISLEYFALTQLQGVEFTFESLSKEYLDNDGKIINNPNTEPVVKYKVTVSYEGVTKEFTYESKLLKL